MTKLDKFSHLDKMDPSVKTILDLDVSAVSDVHLGTLRDNMESHTKNPTPEIREAAKEIIAKIDIIIGKSNRNFVSGEVMEAANNPDYGREYRRVA